jgi:hypothetical protein
MLEKNRYDANSCDKSCGCVPENPEKCCYCCFRYFRNNSGRLASLLAKIKRETLGKPICPQIENTDEKKYKCYNYNGSFHKGLQHNLVDGRLVNSEDYETMKLAIVDGDQKLLASVPLAINSSLHLNNPLGSWSTALIGAEQGVLLIDKPPLLSSDTAAAEMLEVYAAAVARDVSFVEYSTDPTIQQLLTNTYLNNIFVILNLKYSFDHKPFVPETIFRLALSGNELGPYISQFLYLNIIEGSLHIQQKYFVPPTRAEAEVGGFRTEWGVNLHETINIQNGNLSLLPPSTPSNQLIPHYIYSGRALSEAVHNDLVYQFFFQAAAILTSLGATQNPGWPIYPNQNGFVTNNGNGQLYTTISDVSEYALKHAWFWKWQEYRKLRPEVFGLWVEDVLSGLVPNKCNFDIASFLFTNSILADIQQINNSWVPGSNSYTLPLCYREGSPIHPTYIAGHAIIAGACCTILKLFFNGDQLWNTLPGVVSGVLSGIPNSFVQANSDGTILIPYTGKTNNITINDEINKLASNIAFGRSWAGIHYRSDDAQGIKLGEEVAIHYMQDVLSTMVENNLNGKVPTITFQRFNGTYYTIKPTLCESAL